MDGEHGGRALPVMVAWLVHPVTVLAAVVLLLNDHVLKAAHPGLVTGKLSDLAGLVLLPPLLAVILAVAVPARSAAAGTAIAITGLAVSGLAFAAVKALPAGATAISTVYSVVGGPSVILADRTDLAVLPALGVAGWVWTRARRRAASRETLRRFAVVVVLPAAALAVGATSAPEYPDTVQVASWQNLVVLGQANAYHDRRPRDYLVSDQGGAAWRRMTEPEAAAFRLAEPHVVMQARQACVPDDPAHCYRVVPGHLRVVETTDAGARWRVSWQVPDDRRVYLARSLAGVGDKSDNLSSLALAVHPVPGGHVVVVANGRDGCAVRDAGGDWRRIAFGAYGEREVRPAPLSGETRLIDRELVGGILIAFLIVQFGAWTATARTTGWVIAHWIVAGVGVLTTLVGIGGLMLGGFGDLMGWATIVLAGAPLTVGGSVGALALAATQVPRAARWVVLTLLSATAAAAGWVVPFLSWVGGGLTYRQAIPLAFGAALAGVVLTVYLGRRHAPRSRPR